MKYCCRSASRLRVAGSSSETSGVMMAEWNCSRLVKNVSIAAVPIAPPRLRIMLNRPGRAARLARRDPQHRDRRQRGHHHRLTDRADDVRPKELRPGIVPVELDVHEAAGGKDQQADADQPARIEALHQQRHQRDQQQLRQPGPGDHLAGLLRIEALRDGEVLRQQIGRAIEREAQQEVAQRAEAEVAPAEQPQIDQRLRASGIRGSRRRRAPTAATKAQFDDERRAEPVIDVAVVEHGLQGGEADGHQRDAPPVALAQQAELHRPTSAARTTGHRA